MKTLIAKDVVDMVQLAAVRDARGAAVGRAALGAIECHYYPESDSRNWFLGSKGVSNKRDVIAWVSKQLRQESVSA